MGLQLVAVFLSSSLSANGCYLERNCIYRRIGPVPRKPEELDNVGICSEISERQS